MPINKTDRSTSKPVIVILLGPPGSGKGTQAKLLSADLGIPHISTGDIFREHIAVASSIGKKAKEYIQNGQLVPDEVVLSMLFERLERPDCKNGYLLDGVPRNVNQADRLAEQLDPAIPLIVLCLNVKDEIIINRAAGRLLCKDCGTIYNQNASLPKVTDVCDQCGGEVYRRPDDAPEVVSERLRIYHKQTEPLIHYYDDLGLLKCFDGNQEAGKVHSAIKNYIAESTVNV